MLQGLEKECELIGLSPNTDNIKDAKRQFRKRSVAMLPEKHPSVANAHSRFHELNTAFIKILERFRESGERISDVMPGQINVNKLQYMIPLRAGTASFWRKAIKLTYPSVIIGGQKQQNNLANFSQNINSRGIRHVVFWKLGIETGSQPLKVNLIVYDNDILQVTGSSFYLWVLECFQQLSRLAEQLQNQSPTDHEEECCEDRGGMGCSSVDNYKKILEHLQNIEEDIEDLNEKVDELSVAQSDHRKQTDSDNSTTQNRLNVISIKVLEIRQLVGSNAMAKGEAPYRSTKGIKRGSLATGSLSYAADPDLNPPQSFESGEGQSGSSTSSVESNNVKPMRRTRSPEKKPRSPRKSMKREPVSDGSGETKSDNSSTGSEGYLKLRRKSTKKPPPGSPRKRMDSPVKRLPKEALENLNKMEVSDPEKDRDSPEKTNTSASDVDKVDEEIQEMIANDDIRDEVEENSVLSDN